MTIPSRRIYAIYAVGYINQILCFPPYLSVSITQALLTLRRNVYVLFKWKHKTIRVDTIFSLKDFFKNDVEEYPLAA